MCLKFEHWRKIVFIFDHWFIHSSHNIVPHVSHSRGFFTISLHIGHFRISDINDITIKFYILSEGIIPFFIGEIWRNESCISFFYFLLFFIFYIFKIQSNLNEIKNMKGISINKLRFKIHSKI